MLRARGHCGLADGLRNEDGKLVTFRIGVWVAGQVVVPPTEMGTQEEKPRTMGEGLGTSGSQEMANE